MKKITHSLLAIAFILFMSCNSGEHKTQQGSDSPQNTENQEVQQGWLQANEEKMLGVLRSQGFQPQKTGQSQMLVAKYSQDGEGFCVIFVNRKDSLATVACAAYLEPADNEKTHWKIIGYIAAVGDKGKMKTVTFEKNSAVSASNVSTQLDAYLSSLGIEREKNPIENLF